jgi:Ca2+-binding RTX toxin-like protein
MDGVGLGTIGDASRIVVFAGPGHDIVAVSNSVSTPVELYGGPGNDTLKGGSGNDIIVGGDGNDLLSGSYGRDLIIGGDGADILIGNADDDILVAGATSYDADPTALRAIMAEWSSGRNYSTRVANIRGLGSGPRNNGEFFFRTEGELANVFDDGVRDLLMGNAGTDWFIFNKTIGVTDWALDVHSGEFTQDEVMLLSDGTGVIV